MQPGQIICPSNISRWPPQKTASNRRSSGFSNSRSASHPGPTLPLFSKPSAFAGVSVNAFEKLRDNFQDLLDLAASEDGLFKLADELEKTRRRVNALEYILIPDLDVQIRSIESKLSEAERSTQTRLMKIKDMVEARESRQ